MSHSNRGVVGQMVPSKWFGNFRYPVAQGTATSVQNSVVALISDEQFQAALAKCAMNALRFDSVAIGQGTFAQVFAHSPLESVLHTNSAIQRLTAAANFLPSGAVLQVFRCQYKANNQTQVVKVISKALVHKHKSKKQVRMRCAFMTLTAADVVGPRDSVVAANG